MHMKFCSSLELAGYSWKQYILSPIQLGIPNNRKRFYMICEKSSRFSRENALDYVHLHHSEPGNPGSNIGHRIDTMHYTTSGPSKVADKNAHSTVQLDAADADVCPVQIRLLGEFLLPLSPEEIEELTLPLSLLERGFAKGLSVVSKYDQTTFCFTSGYGKVFHKSSGSLYLSNCDHSLTAYPLDRSDMRAYYPHLRLFSPRELLLLFGFPAHISLPEDLSLLQKYRLIGNSISISVTTFLLKLLFEPYRELCH